MDTTVTPVISEVNIEDLVTANEINAVENMIALNCQCVLRNPHLIDLARTPQMVETLLMLTNKTDANGAEENDEPRDNNFEEICNVPDDETCSNEKQDKHAGSDLSMQIIRRTFPKVLENWPFIILKTFDEQIKCKGQFVLFSYITVVILIK